MSDEQTIPESLINRIKNERDRHVGAKRINWPRWVRLELLKLREAGVSTAKLERASGISSSLIHNWARKRAKKNHVKAAVENSTLAPFKEIRISAAPAAELRVRIGGAEILGFTVHTLSEFVREAGWIQK